MNDDLGLSATTFGFAAGVFFIGYILFEIPSNVAMVRVGARRWIARIMISWGLIAAAMAFTPNAAVLIVLRVLLGIAESGLFAGVVLYLTFWFPERKRAQAVSWFMVALPISSAIGATLSGLIIQYGDGLFGLAGWRTMFLIEGLPAVFLGLVVWRSLPDGPRDAAWLEVTEKLHIESQIRDDDRGPTTRISGVREALGDRVVIVLCVLDFTIAYGLYALTFFLPTVVAGFEGLYDTDYSTVQAGAITAVPYATGAVAMIVWSRWTDRARDRPLQVALPMLLAAVSIPAAIFAPTPWTALLAMSGCAAGVFAAFPAFWTLPSARLTGSAAAIGFALITTVGNSAGFAAPYVTGWLNDATQSQRAGLWLTGAVALAGAAIAFGLRSRFQDSGHGPIRSSAKRAG